MPRYRRSTGCQRLARSLVVWAVLALITWLDSDGCFLALRPALPIHTAAVWGAIWTGIQVLAGWIATAAEVTAQYVWIALQWLSHTVGAFLKASGAMFAKVWDGLKIVWSDVLKPALVWVDTWLKRLYAWLKDTFKPVFDFLRDVRKRLMDFYTTFVRPVVDTIEFVRQINRVLLTFHITFLKTLDAKLQQLEQRIDEPFLWVGKKINEIWNALDLVVTADGFFQKLTMIHSMSRYAPAWMNGFWNKQIDKNAQAGSDYDRSRIYPLDAPWANGKELAQFYRGEGSRMDADVAALVPIWRQAAGIDPPTGDYG